MRCEELFYETYGKEAGGIAFAPYRVCPIGAQSDHNLGKITGLAIDKGIYIAYNPSQNGAVELQSMQFAKHVKWSAGEPDGKAGCLAEDSVPPPRSYWPFWRRCPASTVSALRRRN